MSILDRMYEANTRIGMAWPFPCGPMPDKLAEALELFGRLPDQLSNLTQGWRDDEIEELFSGENSANDSFDELCATAVRKGIAGWIGIAECPVFTPTKNGGASFSWGHYRHKLIFAPTSDQMLELAAAWGEKQFADAISVSSAGDGK